MTTLSPQQTAMICLIQTMNIPVDALLQVTREKIEALHADNASVLAAFLGDRAASKDGALAKAAGEAISAEAVGALLRVGRAAVHKAKDEGRLLAYQEPGKRTFNFPIFQFDGAAVAPWVTEVIDVTGNGFAALHFLTVERKQLGGESHLLRVTRSATEDERAKHIAALLKAVHNLVP